jgi:hypothetical protein
MLHENSVDPVPPTGLLVFSVAVGARHEAAVGLGNGLCCRIASSMLAVVMPLIVITGDDAPRDWEAAVVAPEDWALGAEDPFVPPHAVTRRAAARGQAVRAACLQTSEPEPVKSCETLCVRI